MGINIQCHLFKKKQKYERFACTEASSAKFKVLALTLNVMTSSKHT